MPVSVEKRGEKYRIVEPSGKVAKNRAGTPVDGGGHETRLTAVAQARAINKHTSSK